VEFRGLAAGPDQRQIGDFRLLGPVELRMGGCRVDLGHARQRCVLAVLVAEAGQVVPASTLIDRVWGYNPPDAGLNALYAYVARLRKVLGPAGVPVVRRSGGYLLDIDPQTVDLHRFQRFIVSGRVDDALALWRGTPFADMTSEWFGKLRETLRDQRLLALVERTETALRAGRDAELVAPLRELVAEYPTDERPVRQLMLALYRSGRTAEALDQYRQARQRLAARTGGEPSPYLRELHQRVLRADPTLFPERTITFTVGPLALQDTIGRYRQALAIAREIGDRRLEATVLQGIGDVRRAGTR
jgi:DNA-binding SARP family transcriptional activator